MNGDDKSARVRKASAVLNTAARPLECSAMVLSWNRHARNARPSSVESAASTNGFSLGFLSHSLKGSRYAMIEGSNILGVIFGSLASSQRCQLRSRVSNPLIGMASCSASHICAEMDSSSHCSRSLASNALTAFQSPSACLLLAQSVLPGQLRGVTKTKVHSAFSSVGTEARFA